MRRRRTKKAQEERSFSMLKTEVIRWGYTLSLLIPQLPAVSQLKVIPDQEFTLQVVTQLRFSLEIRETQHMKYSPRHHAIVRVRGKGFNRSLSSFTTLYLFQSCKVSRQVVARCCLSNQKISFVRLYTV